MDFETITFEQDGPVARIALNRPDAANGLNELMARELAAAAARCDTDRSVKAVTMSASGRFFCAGGDLRAMAGEADKAAFVKTLADGLHRAISTLARMDAVLIIAVNGVAAGAGMSLAAIGDLVLAAESATFTMAYTKAGLSPDGSSTWFLPRLVGLRRAQDLMITNRTLSATEARDWGLVTEVVADDVLTERTGELAATVAAGSRSSHAAVKRLLQSSFAAGLEEQMELEARAITHCVAEGDGAEGIGAFIEKRPPSFV